MAVRSPVINVMGAAARKAARGLIRDFGEVEQLQVSIKGPGDFVSAADLKAEQTLKSELGRARPGYGMLFEEGGASEGSDTHHRWIVDPLDGTTNFLHGIPHFAISIGLERDGEIIAGIVYEPTRDELYWAEKGARRFISTIGGCAQVSARRQLKAEAVSIGTGLPFPATAATSPENLSRHPGRGDHGHRRGAAIWRRCARPRLRRGGTARWILGIRSVGVGYRRRTPFGPRGGRLC